MSTIWSALLEDPRIVLQLVPSTSCYIVDTIHRQSPKGAVSVSPGLSEDRYPCTIRYSAIVGRRVHYGTSGSTRYLYLGRTVSLRSQYSGQHTVQYSDSYSRIRSTLYKVLEYGIWHTQVTRAMHILHTVMMYTCSPDRSKTSAHHQMDCAMNP